jgi:7-keto-8-aminopelargonate synthetase-like enzyme
VPGRYAALDRRLQDIERRGLRRHLRTLQPTGPTTARTADGSEVQVFCSNDYLGLAQDPRMQAAWVGGGAGSSRLISGDRPAHRALEEALSQRFGRPATLFGSGWQANLAVPGVLLEAGDVVVSDALNHASLIDGMRLSGARRIIAPHGRPVLPPDARLAVVEGLYSMDGDRPDLPAWAGAHWLLVDEAHAVGAIGPGGRGVAAAQGVEPDVLVGTLGKAYGGVGAFVVGPPVLRELLISAGRSFVFTTGLPEGAARAGLLALQLADDERRQRLADRTRRLRAALAQQGIPALGQDHIVPVVLGPRAMTVAAALLERGFLVPGIRPPTVPPGTERLRITLSAAHSEEQIDRLAQALADSLR